MKHTKFFTTIGSISLILILCVLPLAASCANPAQVSPDSYQEEDETPQQTEVQQIDLFKAMDNITIGPLLETKWSQYDEGGWARFAPAETGTKTHYRLGCWSTALAQILYYHSLQPYGTTSYNTNGVGCSSDGPSCDISENLSSYQFNWNLFVNEFDGTTSPYQKNEVARYIYFTSVVIRKDFDTGTYCLHPYYKRADALEHHYNCTTRIYSTDPAQQGYGNGYSLEELKQIVMDEIKQGYPVMMHLKKKDNDSYHAVVVDGIGKVNGRFIFHINMGHAGVDDGWYSFWKIDDYDDVTYRSVIKIRPDTTTPPLTDEEYDLEILLEQQPDLNPGQHLQVRPEAGIGSPWVFDTIMPDQIPVLEGRSSTLDLWEADVAGGR